MLKALLKKQLLEIFNRELSKNKKGQSSGKKTATTGLLYLLIFALLGFSFFSVSRIMCGAMVSAGYGWLYFSVMGLIAVAVGVVGSVFSTYSSLYLAKDNELLLSMPIKPRVILTVRLLAVLLTGAFFELVVILPAVISYCISVERVTAGTIILPLLTVPALAAVIMALSCLLGSLVALISTTLKGNNYIIVVILVVKLRNKSVLHGHLVMCPCLYGTSVTVCHIIEGRYGINLYHSGSVSDFSVK